jgi:hypothetical protein
MARASSQGGAYGRVQAGGILGDIFGGVKKVAGRVAGAAVSLATGGGIGGAVQALTRSKAATGVRTAVMPAVGAVMISQPGPTFAPTQQQLPMGIPQPGIGGAVQRLLPGGATGYGAGCPQGFHPNRSNYWTSQGYVAKGTRCVRNRRRNPLNPRALDRSMGRIASAGKAIKALGFKAPKVKEIAQKGARKRR